MTRTCDVLNVSNRVEGHVVYQQTAWLRRRLFGIDPSETTFAKRKFSAKNSNAINHLEQVGARFVEGYHCALLDSDAHRLAGALGNIDREWQGFAYEGAGMALALLDRVTPGRRDRLRSFLAGPGDRHVYMVTIGAGWAWARLGRWMADVDRELARLDPVLGWFALDGFGFHEGYFSPERTVFNQVRPSSIQGYAKKVFDQGLGRSLWFVCGADAQRVADQIESFAPDRHADLWSGTGLASSYACGVSESEIDDLVERSGTHRASLAQGAAFAAKARERAGNPVAHTDTAVSRICATSAELVAKLCDTTFESLARPTPEKPSAVVFEGWRADIRESLERSFPEKAA